MKYEVWERGMRMCVSRPIAAKRLGEQQLEEPPKTNSGQSKQLGTYAMRTSAEKSFFFLR